MNRTVISTMLLMAAFATMGADCSSSSSIAQQKEQQQVGAAYRNILRNQPPPSFDFSMERHIMIEIYRARQRAVATYSVVQSPYTGKILWSCPSIGYPVPYSTQLTNPDQIVSTNTSKSHVIPQAEPNGLFPPPESEATWIPCVDKAGAITPVYEEKQVTVFLRPEEERNGQLYPISGTKPSLEIQNHHQ